MKSRAQKFVHLLLLAVSVFCTASRAETWVINSETSYIHVLTQRAGLFSRLAHRHVVELGPLTGTIELHTDEPSTAQLQLLPAKFRVDRPATTALYPDIWDKPVNRDAAQGTRGNMLGKRQLDAENFPAIDVAIQVERMYTPVFLTRIDLKGRQLAFEFPGEVAVNSNRLTASANFTLTHRQLGLERYKAAGGTVAVGKKLAFRVYIEAWRSDSETVEHPVAN